MKPDTDSLASEIVSSSHFESYEQCIKKIRQGDTAAFEVIFRTYNKDLYRFLWGYVQREDVAEGLVQEVFLKLWEQRHSLDPSKKVKALLYKIGRNLAIDYLRHKSVVNEWEVEKKALKKFSTNVRTLDEELYTKMMLEEVKATIQEMPERRRLVFVMSRYNDMTYKEIAEALDISVCTVETQISRALKTLREKFSLFIS